MNTLDFDPEKLDTDTILASMTVVEESKAGTIVQFSGFLGDLLMQEAFARPPYGQRRDDEGGPVEPSSVTYNVAELIKGGQARKDGLFPIVAKALQGEFGQISN